MNAYIMPTGFGWEPYRTLDNDERLASWAAKYYSAGHHRRTNSTARKPQASDTAAKRQGSEDRAITALSDPLIATPAPGSQFAEAGLITNEVNV
jgi:hypothetical protein